MSELVKVHYSGGSADGITVETDQAVFYDHPQRELNGTDMAAPFELYRNRGRRTVTLADGQGGTVQAEAVVFEFEAAHAAPTLDSEMEPLAP